MNNRQGNTLQAYRRVQIFADTNVNTLGAITQCPPRQTLDSVVLNLSAYASDQATALTQRVGATHYQSVLRRQLVVNHMRPVVKVAKDIVAGTPEASAFTMPAPKLNVERLVAAANAMVAAATPFAQTFINDGLPPDFLAQLSAAALAVTGQVNVQGSSQTSRRQATAGVAYEIQRGRRALDILGSLIVPALAGNASLLAGWEAAKRITPQASASAAAKPVQPVTPTPVVPAVPAVQTSTIATVATSGEAAAPVPEGTVTKEVRTA